MRKPMQQRHDGDPGCVLVDESEEGTETVCVPDGGGAAETVRFVRSAEAPPRKYGREDEYEEDCAGRDEDMDAFFEPSAKVPYSGVYVMANPTGEAADTERAAGESRFLPAAAGK